MQFHKLILATTWVPEEYDMLSYRLVLHQESNGRYCYNKEDSDGIGWETSSSEKLSNILETFMFKFKQSRKCCKTLDIIASK